MPVSDVHAWIRSLVGADVVHTDRLQSLWSGYGAIERVHLSDGTTVVLKRVEPPSDAAGSRSHARKVRSYAVEQAWYAKFAGRCGERSRVPRCLGLTVHDGGRWFLLEDLDAAGFGGRRHGMSGATLSHCLTWLAEFHATFLGVEPLDLWPVGTYWHLDTRPDELRQMADGRLKDAAPALDRALNGAEFQTLVHGDAKPANFCFGADGVAAVDFQYVGGGCGMKDVAYLLGALRPGELDRSGDRALDAYFGALRSAVADRGVEVDLDGLQAEWRRLFPVAWADFDRFMEGWAPGCGTGGRWAAKQIDVALASV
jgi:hypothetical protein